MTNATRRTTASLAAQDVKPEKLTPATDVAASGAMIEPKIVDRIDTGHLSVDDNPRAASTPEMNQIDFNEPSALVPPEEAVAKALAKSGKA